MNAIQKKRKGQPRKARHDIPGVEILPDSVRDRSHLYLIMFSGGLLKVGRAQRPRDRMTQFTRHQVAVTRTVEWVHLFAPMRDSDAKKSERAAIKRLHSLGVLDTGTEWFRTNASRGVLIAAIREVIATA